MNLLLYFFTFVLIVLHIYFLVLEMFFWTKPKGLKTFGMTLSQAESSKVLAMNQGLYNGFLAAGLAWGLLHPVGSIGLQIILFFTSCIFVAAIYGGLTVNKKIFYVQGLPALINGLIVLLLMFQV